MSRLPALPALPAPRCPPLSVKYQTSPGQLEPSLSGSAGQWLRASKMDLISFLLKLFMQHFSMSKKSRVTGVSAYRQYSL